MKENKNQPNSSVTDDKQQLQNNNDINTEQNTTVQKDGFRYDYDDSSNV